MKVFLGSSNESIETAYEIAEIIAELGHEPAIWNKQFIASDFTFEALENITKKVDSAILIFNEDDKTWFGNKLVSATRDNVLFEYGLFCGKLERKNVAFCVIGAPKIPSDLSGITYISMKDPIKVRNSIKVWLDRCRGNFLDLQRIENTLMINGNDCLITLPLVARELAPKHIVRYVRAEDVPLQFEICKLLSKLDNINVHISQDDYYHYGTEIHIGNASTSEAVNRYLKLTFPDFKWNISDENFFNFFVEEEFNMLPHPEIRKHNPNWEGLEFNGKEYEYIRRRQDWAFLLRLGKDNFPGEQAKTVHVLFGISAAGRKGAVNYLVKNYHIINERWGENDYLLASKVS